MANRRKANARSTTITMSILALLIPLLVSGPTVAAQEIEEAFDLGIVAVNCDDQAPDNITVQQGGCEPAEGVVFTVTIEGGEPVGSCTAVVAAVADPITAGCSVAIPYGATVVVNEDPASLPAGYEPVANGQIYTAPTEPPSGQVGGVTFVNLLQVDDTAPVATDNAVDDTVGTTTLPDTGIGTAGQEERTSNVITLLVFGSAMTLVGGLAISRWSVIRP